MHLAKEMVEEGRAAIVHIMAPEMKADGFSKPYDEAKHRPFARSILGEVQLGRQVGVEVSEEE